MKTRKLLSLVLALAMSLMAMGVTALAEGENVAKIGETEYATLADAYNAAVAGDTITLLKDVDMSSYYGSNTRFPISKSMTIDGAGYTITVKGRGFGVGMNASSNIDVTFKNVTIKNTADGGRCIDTRGNIGTLTLDSVNLTCTGSSGYLQPLTIGGNQSTTATVNIIGGEIKTTATATGDKGYAIITFNPVKMTLTGTNVSGWACMYFKGPDGSAGSAGSTVTVNGGIFTSKNIYSGETNAFGLLKFEDNDVSVDFTNATLNVSHTGNQPQAIAAYDDFDIGGNVTLGAGNDVKFEGDLACFASNDGVGTLSITGGTYNLDPSEYVANGYVAVDMGDGTYKVGEYKETALAQVAAETGYDATYQATKKIVDDEGQTIQSQSETTVNLKAVDISENDPNVDSYNQATNGIANDSFKFDKVVSSIFEDAAVGNRDALNVDVFIAASENVVGSNEYTVAPMADVYDGNELVASVPLTNDELADGASFDITLPVTGDLANATKVKVTHISDDYGSEIGIYPVSDGKVTITGVTHFSTFKLSAVNSNGEVAISKFDSYKGNDGYWNLRAISQVLYESGTVEYYGTWFIPNDIRTDDATIADEDEDGRRVTFTYETNISSGGKFRADLMKIPDNKGDTEIAVLSFFKLTDGEVVRTDVRTTTASANKNYTSAE